MRTRFLERVKFGLVVFEVFNQIDRLTGFHFSLYYVFRGFVDSQEPQKIDFTGFEFRALGLEDMRSIAGTFERTQLGAVCPPAA